MRRRLWSLDHRGEGSGSDGYGVNNRLTHGPRIAPCRPAAGEVKGLWSLLRKQINDLAQVSEFTYPDMRAKSMPKKPSAVDDSTILATKEKAAVTLPSGALQRGQAVTETLVDLNFKVPSDIRHCFKQLALDAQLKCGHLLVRAVEDYDREREKRTSRSAFIG